MFYTNGCVIAGADDKILENGDNLNPGNAHKTWCETYNFGYAGGPQNAVILPLPDSNGVYYLFCKSFIVSPQVVANKLMYNVVDMRLNNGKGKVIQKNVELLSDMLSFGEIAAVKHANAKDWWLVTTGKKRNQFYTYRLGKAGITDSIRQTIGILPNPEGESLGQIVFSPDGKKLYRTNRYDPVLVYDFDRETGMFNAFDTVHFEYGNQLIGETGCAVSPSGQFLYLACRKFLYQLDLWASDISASQTTVAEWDGFADPIPTMFYQLQLGPDCKIYGLGGGDTRFFHVIHNPDEKGMACNVEQRGLPLPTRSGASMPSFPNYRLGPLDNPGLPCSPVVSATAPPTPLPGFSVFPNPVITTLRIVPNRPYTGRAQLRLYDVTGRPVKELPFDPQAPATETDLQEVKPGIYFYELWCEGKMQRAGKVVKAGG